MSSRYHSTTKPILKLTAAQRLSLHRFKRRLDEGIYSFEASACLCGETEGRLVASRDRYDLSVMTHLCRLCGVMWTSPRMTNESLQFFYEEDYRSIYVGTADNPERFFQQQVIHGKNIYDYVNYQFASRKGLTVFDVGCGAGGTLVQFRESGWKTYGCDLGGRYINYGLERGLELVQGDASSLTNLAPADLIILSHVLEHLPHPRRTLRQLYTLLSDNGFIYVELPGIYNIHKSYGDFLLFLQNAHLYHFTLNTLTSLMGECGFELVVGDERIRALFCRSLQPKNFITKNEYTRILLYLVFVELYRRFRLKNLTSNVERFLIKARRKYFLIRRPG